MWRETVIGDDLGGAEVLELGRVRPGFFGQADEQLGALQVAVVVGGDVGDEVGGVVGANDAGADLDFHVEPPGEWLRVVYAKISKGQGTEGFH